MKYIYEVLSIITPFIITWAIMYLICAFVNLSWNFADWTHQARTVCAVWSTVFGLALWYRLEKAHE